MVYQPNATRSIEWLEENGKCIDNIYPGQSTINGAGHGAFAKRDLLKGTIISGSPLLHVPFNNAFMPMYRIYTHEESVYVDTREVVSQQLILNYCFGHSETPLLLCPCKYGWFVFTYWPTTTMYPDTMMLLFSERWYRCKLH
jgi:hypothetical protein